MIILSLDPGQTTGVCVFRWDHGRQIRPKEDISTNVVKQLQIGGGKDIEKQIEELKEIIERTSPDVVVFEKFLLYGDKSASQTGSDMYTSQIIGIIKHLCSIYQIPVIEQMAVSVKKFYTDKKLKEHGLYIEGLKHSRDATRHAVYAVDFNLFKGKR